jgi:regulator of PEP synthase PpsR (kinase-PPPase family)
LFGKRGEYVTEQKAKPVVYVISDSAGETGEFVVRAAVTQFYPVSVDIRRVSFVEDKSSIDSVVKAAKANKAMIVFTLVIPELRNYLIRQCSQNDVPYIDVIGPIIDNLENMLGREARHQPGPRHMLDEDYFKKVEAIEFAVKYDDAKDPSGIAKSDLVLIGVSRTSKTPLSMYLAHKRYKVANVPLVPEITPPKELFSARREKIIGLMIHPDKLNEIRMERLKSLGLASEADYASMARIRKELDYAKEIMNRIGCGIIDVSNKAVEETAAIIQELLHSKDGLFHSK